MSLQILPVYEDGPVVRERESKRQSQDSMSLTPYACVLHFDYLAEVYVSELQDRLTSSQ